MLDSSRPAAARACAVWLLVTAAAAAVAVAALPTVARAGAAAGFADLLVAGCAAASLPTAGWLWLVTTDVVVRLLRPGEADAPRRTGPTAALVLAACGVAVLAAPAAADDPDVEHQRRLAPGLLAGLPLPDRPTGPLLAPVARPADRAGAGWVVVRPGDTLWAIAADRLGPRATAADITAHWRLVHALNADVIGPDPHLIRPGQRLRLPPTTTRNPR